MPVDEHLYTAGDSSDLASEPDKKGLDGAAGGTLGEALDGSTGDDFPLGVSPELARPAAVSAAADSGTAITVSFTAVGADTEAEVVVFEDAGSGARGDFVKKAESATNAASLQITGLTASTDYYFLVRKVKAGRVGPYAAEVLESTTA